MREGWEKIPFTKSLRKTKKTNKIPKKAYLEQGEFPIVAQGEMLVEGYWDRADDVYRLDNPVVIFGDHTKHVKYVDFDFVVGADGVKILAPKEGLNTKFFFYQIKSLEIEDLGYARHFRLLKEKELWVPPLPEQKRIVAILDEAFEAIDQAIANIERNIQNAEELFQSKLNEVFSRSGEGWKEKKLKDICSGFQYGTSSKSLHSGEVPVLRMGNIRNRLIDWSDLKYTDDTSDIKKYELKEGDVLFNRTNSPELVGKSAIFRGERNAIFAGYLIRIRGVKNVLSNEYLNFYLNSQRTLEYGQRVMTSSVNQANISASKLKEYVISIPSFDYQIQLETYLNNLDEEINNLRAKYSEKLLSLEELKKSLLQKAFSGELTKNEEIAA